MNDTKIVRAVEKEVNKYWLKLIRDEKEPVEQLTVYLNALYYCNPMVELGINLELQKIKPNYNADYCC